MDWRWQITFLVIGVIGFLIFTTPDENKED